MSIFNEFLHQDDHVQPHIVTASSSSDTCLSDNTTSTPVIISFEDFLTDTTPTLTASNTENEPSLESNSDESVTSSSTSNSPIVTSNYYNPSSLQLYVDLPIPQEGAQPVSTHSMTMRSKSRDLSMHHSLVVINSQGPTTISEALSQSHWVTAMNKEIQALNLNHTWDLVPRTPTMHVIGSKWVCRTKLKPDGSVDRFKARLVAKGYNQVKGVDFSEKHSAQW